MPANDINTSSRQTGQGGEIADLGAPIARPGLAYHLIPVASSKFGRAVAFIRWQQNGRDRNCLSLASARCQAGDPPSHKPTEAVADLYERYLAPLSSLGDHRAFTPLSAHGPGCSGSIPSRTNVVAKRLGPILWARTGASAMISPLFNLGAGRAIDYAARAVECPLCHGPAPLDCYHLVAECTHPALNGWRRRCEAALRRVIVRFLATLRSERQRAGREPDDRLFDNAERALRRVDFNSPQGDFLLYRFLVVHPWTERMAQPHMLAARLLGRVFDLPGVYHRFERPAADIWTRWGLRWLWQLSDAWRLANAT